jgi:hypothetical protein
MGDLGGAIADFEKALEVAPANWSHRRRTEESLANVRQALGRE